MILRVSSFMTISITVKRENVIEESRILFEGQDIPLFHVFHQETDDHFVRWDTMT